MFLCDSIVYVFMCYVILVICFMFCVIKTWNTPGHQGDSAHSCYSDKGKGGRSTLVLNFKSELKKEFQWRVLKN